MCFAKRAMSKIVIVGLLFSFMGCADDKASTLEEAQFLLDEGNFTQAELKTREVLASDPTNTTAKYLLAKSLFGTSVLGQGNTFLSLFSDVLEEQGDDESELQTFARIAPELDEAGWADLEEATDVLAGIDDALKNGDVHLLLYITRMFEVSAAVSTIGGVSDDVRCNYGPGTEPDGVPDDLDPTGLEEERNNRFRINLDEAPANATGAGLPSDFDITSRFSEMLTDLDVAIAAAPDFDAGVEQFFIDQFPVEAGSACPIAP